MTTLNDSGGIDEAEIRALIQDRVKAVHDKNVDASAASFAPGVLAFDLIGPLQYVGAASLKKRLEEWFRSFQGPLGYEMHDLVIAAADGVAYSHSLNKVNGIKLDGKELVMWWRETICYRKIEGEWIVTHEHSSVPFDGNTGKALLDLKPSPLTDHP